MKQVPVTSHLCCVMKYYCVLSMRAINFDLPVQLLEQLTEMKQTANELTGEPLEMVDLLQHVSDLEEQNIREAEVIRQTKEELDFSKEVL